MTRKENPQSSALNLLVVNNPDCWGHDWEGYFESLAEQGFQNNPFFRSGTKK